MKKLIGLLLLGIMFAGQITERIYVTPTANGRYQSATMQIIGNGNIISVNNTQGLTITSGTGGVTLNGALRTSGAITGASYSGGTITGTTISGSALQVNGGVTANNASFSGTVSANEFTSPSQPMIKFYRSGTQPIANGQNITFNVTANVTNGFSLNNTTGQITVQKAGTYLINSTIRLNDYTTAGYVVNTINKNGSAINTTFEQLDTGKQIQSIVSVMIVQLAVNDIITNTLGYAGATGVIIETGEINTFLQITKLF